MPQDVMASRDSKVNKASQGALGRWINLVEIKAANPVSQVNRANPVRAASPDNRGSKQMEIRPAGLAAPVRLIASGTAAIPEATGRRVAKRNQCLPHRKKFSDLTRRPCAS